MQTTTTISPVYRSAYFRMSTITIPHLPISLVEDEVLLCGISLHDAPLRDSTRAIHTEAESQIKQLEESVMILQAHIATRKRLAELCVHGLSTINQLPDELLTLILETTVNNIHENAIRRVVTNNSTLYGHLRLGHVSKKWRRLLHGTANLWQRLAIFIPLVGFEGTYPLVKVWMHRSSNLPLTLKVIVGEQLGLTSVSLESLYNPELFEPLCMLARHSARWKRLELRVRIDLNKLSSYPFFRRRYDCPILESIHITGVSQLPAFLHLAPALNNVSFTWRECLRDVDNLEIFCRDVALRIPSLRHITWRHSSMNRYMPGTSSVTRHILDRDRRMAEAVYTLTNLPNLTTFGVTLVYTNSEIGPGIGFPNFVVPNLKTLVLSGDASLLQFVDLPGLETLRLGHTKVYTGLEFLPDFWHRTSSLRNVVIRPPGRLDWFKVGMLASPSITCISLRLSWSLFSNVTEVFAVLLKTTTVSMFPCLEWLGLHMDFLPSPFQRYREGGEDGPEVIGWPLGGAVRFVAVFSGHLHTSAALPVLKKVVVKVSTTSERKAILQEALLEADDKIPEGLIIDVRDDAPPFEW
ncbi:hypothetical protein DL96DRAFT_1617491 [Flagelloscypha sp. PMI_526]|nr:hypothetical protein DL96DRAFT_1617491 [Flagelloscypha sp. PMI_526]